MPARAEAPESELRRRLAEAEDTLRAIREGEVDALVMRGPQHDEIFALGGQDSYRAFMEAMDTGAAALDADGNLVYANAALCELVGRSPRDLQQDGLFAALGALGSHALRQLLSATTAGPRQSRQLSVPCAGGFRHIEVAAAPLSLGFGAGHALTFTDVTERVEAAALHESERVGRAIMASSTQAVVVCDRAGTITQANAGIRQFREGRVVGEAFEAAFPLEFPIASGLLSGADLIGIALGGTAVRGVAATLGQDGHTQEVMVGAAPLRQAGDAVFGCIVTMADVTELRAGEKRQALLMGELTHRVRNTLTLVMAIANRTLAGARELGEFQTAFSRRIEALAATHNLLVQGAWDGLTVEQIVTAELAPYVTLASGRVRLDGEETFVGADVAVAFGLVLHELVTNAVKYGALSNETGRIAIAVNALDDGTEIVWREEGGPPVIAPQKLGFGQTLIARGLGHAGARRTQVEFRPEGLVCRMYIAPRK